MELSRLLELKVGFGPVQVLCLSQEAASISGTLYQNVVLVGPKRHPQTASIESIHAIACPSLLDRAAPLGVGFAPVPI